MQKEIIETGGLHKLGEILLAHNVRRVLLVTGTASYEACGAKENLEQVLSGISVTHFHDFDVNPGISDIDKGIELCKDKTFDLVLAVGGGSVMDMAKLVNVLSHQPDNPETYIRGEKQLIHPGAPLVAVPTTAGSGSEATRFAVAYVDQAKYSLSHPYLLPEYVVIDPSLTFNMKSFEASVCAMDALSQAIESYWSVCSSKQSRTYATEAIRLIKEVLEPAIKGDWTAREKMARAANLAGKAINLTTTTAPHALSYFLTTHFKIPHGHAVAVLLGEMFVENGQTQKMHLAFELDDDEYRVRMERLFSLLGCADAHACRDQWYEMMRAIGLETSLHKLGGVTFDDLQAMASAVNVERLQNNPVQLTESDLYEFLVRVYKSH